MPKIDIPDPDFCFSNVIIRQTDEFCNSRLSYNSIINVAQGIKVNKFYYQIEAEYSHVKNQNDRIFFISGIITHLYNVKKSYQTQNGISNDLSLKMSKSNADIQIGNLLEDLLYYVYNLSSANGYNFDRDAFQENEIDVVTTKVDAIVDSLDKIQAGQEILFNFIEELKMDFESLKSDLPLGRKRWYQRAAGIVFTYMSTKGADELFESIKPSLIDLLETSPDILKKLII